MNYELWTVSVFVLAYLDVSIPVIYMYLHAHHYGTETVGEGGEHGELSHCGKYRAVYLASGWHQETAHYEQHADC